MFTSHSADTSSTIWCYKPNIIILLTSWACANSSPLSVYVTPHKIHLELWPGDELIIIDATCWCDSGIALFGFSKRSNMFYSNQRKTGNAHFIHVHYIMLKIRFTGICYKTYKMWRYQAFTMKKTLNMNIMTENNGSEEGCGKAFKSKAKIKQ